MSKEWSVGGSSMKDMTVQTMIVDSHPFFQKTLRQYLAGFKELKVVNVSSNGRDALLYANWLSPDLLLMDVHLPGMDGLTVSRFVKKQSMDTQIILYSMIDLRNYPSDLLEYTDIFVSKDRLFEELPGIIAGMSLKSGET